MSSELFNGYLCIYKQIHINSFPYFTQIEEFCMHCSVPCIFQEVIFREFWFSRNIFDKLQNLSLDNN